jgi:hypothetical protein
MAIQLGSAYGKVSIDSSGVSAGVGNAKAKLMELADLGMQIGGKLQDLGGKMTLGLTLPIVAFGALAVKEAAQTEVSLADLNAVIASTKGVAGVTAKSVEDYANKMQLLTKFSDDQIISGNAMLLTFTKIGKEVFPQASDATLDLAQKFGMDLSQASILLGKALNDPVAGVGALRRIGVQLSAQQEQQIKDFMAINDIASAQKVILGELSTEVGGMAQAYGKTFAGQLAIFNHRLDDMKEKIGVQLIPALIRLMDAATPLLNWFSNASPATIDFIIAIGGIVAAAGPVVGAIGTLVKVFSFFSPGGGGGMFVSWITGTLIPSFGGVSIAAGGTGVAIGTIVLPLLLIIGTLVLVYLAFKNNWFGITDTVKQAWFLIGYYVAQGIAKFKAIGITLRQLWSLVQTSFAGWGKAIDWVITKVHNLGVALGLVKLPKNLTPGSPTPFEIGLLGIATAMDKVSAKAEKMGMSMPMSGKDWMKSMDDEADAQMKNIEDGIKRQKMFQEGYFKNIGDLLKQNTKNQNAAMKAQALATQQSLKAQAEAMQRYQQAAAQFWSGTGIAMGQAQSSFSASANTNSNSYIEQINSSVNMEQAKPQTIQVIQNFSSGITIEKAQQMISGHGNNMIKGLAQAMGGA